MYENLFILLLVIVLVCITTRKITEHFQQTSNATTFNITANKLSYVLIEKTDLYWLK